MFTMIYYGLESARSCTSICSKQPGINTTPCIYIRLVHVQLSLRSCCHTSLLHDFDLVYRRLVHSRIGHSRDCGCKRCGIYVNQNQLQPSVIFMMSVITISGIAAVVATIAECTCIRRIN